MTAKSQREKWLPLLQRMLSCLRRSRETPLQFEVDSAGVVAAALADFPEGIGDELEQAGAVLDGLIEESLREEGACDADGVPLAGSAHANPPSLAVWLERFYRAVRGVHPSAIDIIALRLEGFAPRDIAERLGLGLRLVRSIMRETRTCRSGESEIR